MKREELHWKQKSRETWLTSLDLNTKYFHLSTVIKRRRNAIDFLIQESGLWTLDENEIGQAFVTTTQTSTPHLTYPSVQNLFPPCINSKDNQFLSSIPDNLEIQQAVFSLGSLKAPGPDGMPCLFYRKNWSTVGGIL